MKAVKVVIFDFDGVLVDTYNTAKHRLPMILADHGITVLPRHWEKAVAQWGQAGPAFLEECFDMKPADAERAYNDWEHRDSDWMPPFVLGGHEAVWWCWDNGIIPCLLTSRYRLSLDPILKQAGLDDAFRVITAHQDTEFHKPDPRAFNHILNGLAREHDVGPEDCVFIGDTKMDIEAGRRANICTVVVETGPYHDGHKRTHPVPDDHVLPTVAYLPKWIERRS